MPGAQNFKILTEKLPSNIDYIYTILKYIGQILQLLLKTKNCKVFNNFTKTTLLIT